MPDDRVIVHNSSTGACQLIDRRRGKTCEILPGVNKIDKAMFEIFKEKIEGHPNLHAQLEPLNEVVPAKAIAKPAEPPKEKAADKDKAEAKKDDDKSK